MDTTSDHIARGQVQILRRHMPDSDGRWSKDEMQSFLERDQMLRMLAQADAGDAIGAATAFLLHAAERHPHVLKAVLRTPVVPGRTILDVLSHTAGTR